jgi:hypothetical protein
MTAQATSTIKIWKTSPSSSAGIINLEWPEEVRMLHLGQAKL